MRPHRWNAGVAAVLAVAGYGVCGGCSTPSNPWAFSEPPAVAAGGSYARPHEPQRTVIAVTKFANPDEPQLDWPDLGAKVSEAMRRTLLNEGDFVVRSGPDIDRLVASARAGTKDPSVDTPVDVDFVLTGKVTDFHHTAWLPKDASRWSFLWRRSEAVVAIDWKVIDVRTRRVVAADHTYGNHDAGRKTKPEESYYGLDLSAYLFWNTPLGKACRRAIDKSIKRMRAQLPGRLGEPTVVKVQAGGRKLAIEGGWSWGLAEGQEYYLTARDNDQSQPYPIHDPDTGRPLMVKITKVKKNKSTAWLLGKVPPDVDLLGATLARDPVTAQLDDLARREALSGGRDDDT